MACLLVGLCILLCAAGSGFAKFHANQPFIDPRCHSNCSWEFSDREDGEFVLRTQNCTTLDYVDDGSLDNCPIPTKNAQDLVDRASPVKDVTMEEFNKTFGILETGDEDFAGSYTCLRISYTIDPAVAEKLQAIQFILAGASTLEGNMQFCQNHHHGDSTEYYAVQHLNEQSVYEDRIFTYECFCGLMPGLDYRFDIRALPVDFTDLEFPYDTVVRLYYPRHSNNPESSCTTKPDDKRCDLNEAAKWHPECFDAYQPNYDTVEALFTIAPSELGFDRYKVFIQQMDKILTSFTNRMDWVESTNCSGTLQQVSKMNVSAEWSFGASCDYRIGLQAFPLDLCKYNGGSSIGCPVSWTNPFCVIANPCDDSPCTDNGKCDPDEDRYTCLCDDGYMFANGTCVVDPCFNNPCNDTAGSCNRNALGEGWEYYCTCNDGYTLTQDEQTCVVDPCYTNPCGNNGTCHLEPFNSGLTWQFYCICDQGFTNSSTTCNKTKSNNLPIILAAVGGTLAGVLLILLLIYIFPPKRPISSSQSKKVKKSSQSKKDPPIEVISIRCGTEHLHHDHDGHNPGIRIDPITSQSPSGCPRVFILYSEDHEYHKEAVRMFATFLQEFCHCQVRLDMWCTTEIGYKRDWLISEIMNADKVLMIFSEGTLATWKAAVMKTPAADINMSGEFGDMFLPGYRYALKEIEGNLDLLSSKYVVALFEYSKKDHILPDVGNGTYQIPQNLEKLFFRLYDIPKYSPKSSRRAQGCHPDDLQGSREGLDLYTAIKQMSNFVKANPDWYDSPNRLASAALPDEGYSSNLNNFFQQAKPEDIKEDNDHQDDDRSSHSNFSRDYHIITEESGLNGGNQNDEFHEWGFDQVDIVPHPQRTSDPVSLSDVFEEHQLADADHQDTRVGINEYDIMANDAPPQGSYPYEEDPQVFHTLNSDDVQIHLSGGLEIGGDEATYMMDYHIAN